MPNNNPAKLAKLRMPDYSGSWWQSRPKYLTTLPVGKWTPVTVMDIPANTLIKMKPSLRYEGLPQISPLYGGWTQRTKYYICPYRLYIPELRKNLQQNWGSIPNLDLPTFQYNVNVGRFAQGETFNTTAGQSFVKSVADTIPLALTGSLVDRLNMFNGELLNGNSFNRKKFGFIKGTFDTTDSDTRDFAMSFKTSLVPLLAYIDAWLYGEFNPQDKNIPVDDDILFVNNDHTISRVTTTQWVSSDKLKNVGPAFGYNTSLVLGVNAVKSARGIQMSNLHTMTRASNGDYFDDKSISFGLWQEYPLFSTFSSVFDDRDNAGWDNISRLWSSLRNTTSCVGLLPVTYKGDYFTSWFSSEGIQIAQNYTISQGESFFSLRKKNQDFILSLLSMVGGNRWVDYLQFVMDTDLELKDHPIMIGYDEIDFGGIDIISNANTGEGNNALGSTGVLGGTAHKVTKYNESTKPFSCKLKEPALLLVCSAIVPNVYYYQGTPRFMDYRKVADLWHPQYQKQGFTQLRRSEFINPFVADVSYVVGVGSEFVTDGETTQRFYGGTPLNLNQNAVTWVPLGWEYMQRPSFLTGGMKTPQFKTWSLHRDFTSAYSVAVEGNTDESYLTGLEEVGFDPWSQNGLNLMRSTYVDSGSYNYMFNNTSKGGQNNFVVRFEYDMSCYQPLVHTLVDKQGL